MPITEDLRKTVTDPTPLYVLAGTADLAAEKLREVPGLIEKLRAEAPDRIAAVKSADTKAVQDRVAKQTKEAQDRLTELLGTIDTDLKKIRESAQDLALQGVGRAAEYAVKARETYDELAERGRGAVKTWRGEAADEVTEIAVVIEPESAPEAGPTAATGAPEPAGPAAAKKTTARRTTAKKIAPKSNE
jgi:hypothetical protein